jgi:mannose-6-phosphate isomerase-like protein (cupin superfamily)
MQKHLFRAPVKTFSATLICCFAWAGPACSQQNAAPAPTPQMDQQAAYFSHGDMDTVWKELEENNAISKRVVEGGKYSINIRSIRETDAPLIHPNSIDIWIMEEGSAVAITGGTLVNPVKKPKLDDIAGTAIEGGTEHPFLPGDILYVPAGVAHGFKNTKNFRAYLIRIVVN